MKKKILLLLFLLLPFFLITKVFAQNETTYQKNIFLPTTAVINEDYFAAGDNVTVSGTVNGDAYVAGGNVLIDGTINGDLLVAGGTVTIRGVVSQDIRAAGGTVIIASDVGKNITVAGGTIVFPKEARLQGSAVIAGGTIQIYSPIAKNLTIGAGSVTIGNRIGGHMQAGIGELTFTHDASVSGNINYYSDNPARIEKGASLSGTISYHKPPQSAVNQQEAAKQFVSKASVGITFVNLITTLVLGLLFLWAMPVFAGNAIQKEQRKFWLSLLIGCITIIISPVVTLVLFITLIGIPFSLLFLFTLCLLILFAKILVAYTIGVILTQYTKLHIHYLLQFVLGLLLYTIITWIPVLGPLFSVIAILSGMGALLIEKKESYLLLRSKNLM